MKIGFIDSYIDEWHANNYSSFMSALRFSLSWIDRNQK